MESWKPKDPIFIRSYAKIHVAFDILGKRPDGFHEMASIVQTVDLYDTICLRTIPHDTVQFDCSIPELNNPTNLAVRAAEAVRHRFKKLIKDTGVRIELQKRIPVGAGLGGASSNAASVILGMKRLFHIPATWRDFFDLGMSIGPNVVFFLYGVVSLCEGREGEYVTPLKPVWPASMRWILLLMPAINECLESVSDYLTASDYTESSNSNVIRNALLRQEVWNVENMHNCLEARVLEGHPEVVTARDAMLLAGSPHVQLSGSGPSLFALFRSFEDATNVKDRLVGQGFKACITRPVNESEIDFY